MYRAERSLDALHASMLIFGGRSSLGYENDVWLGSQCLRCFWRGAELVVFLYAFLSSGVAAMVLPPTLHMTEGCALK